MCTCVYGLLLQVVMSTRHVYCVAWLMMQSLLLPTTISLILRIGTHVQCTMIHVYSMHALKELGHMCKCDHLPVPLPSFTHE